MSFELLDFTGSDSQSVVNFAIPISDLRFLAFCKQIS